jgi:hypothetical protein
MVDTRYLPSYMPVMAGLRVRGDAKNCVKCWSCARRMDNKDRATPRNTILFMLVEVQYGAKGTIFAAFIVLITARQPATNVFDEEFTLGNG